MAREAERLNKISVFEIIKLSEHTLAAGTDILIKILSDNY